MKLITYEMSRWDALPGDMIVIGPWESVQLCSAFRDEFDIGNNWMPFNDVAMAFMCISIVIRPVVALNAVDELNLYVFTHHGIGVIHDFRKVPFVLDQ